MTVWKILATIFIVASFAALEFLVTAVLALEAPDLPPEETGGAEGKGKGTEKEKEERKC